MENLSDKLETIIVETKSKKKKFIIFKKTLYPYKILNGTSYPLPKFIDPKIIIDVGANIGAASFYFSETYPNSTIYAFEPAKDLIQILKKNLKTNNNVEIINKAVSNKNEKHSKFFIDYYNYDGSSLYKEYHQTNNLDLDKYEIVETIDLFNFCLENNIREIDILKVDAEGSEFEIIETLIKNEVDIKLLYCESHNKKNYKKISELLKDSFNIKKDLIKNNESHDTIYLSKKLNF